MAEQLTRVPEKEVFFGLLSKPERKRVNLLLEIIDAYPLYKGRCLWVAGIGSVAREDPNARDIDILVWLHKGQRRSFNNHLIMSFEKHGIDCTQNTVRGSFGLPAFVRKSKTWSDKSDGRAIKLIVHTSRAADPKKFIDNRINRIATIEFLRKGF